MKNQINFVEIKNFKTIKHVKFDTKRINIFVGKPNVGKSNLLEALGLFSGIFHKYQPRKKFLSDFIRFNNYEELFFDKDTSSNIEVNSNAFCVSLKHYSTLSKPNFNLAFNSNTIDNKDVRIIFNPGGEIINAIELPLILVTPFKKYDFIKLTHFTESSLPFLLPPHGINLYSILRQNKKLNKEIGALFKEYKSQLVLALDKSQILLQKKQGRFVYQNDYFLIADTLQRYIFYLLAIETNKDSVLLFEEPEAHSYPPYVHDIAQKIVADKNNQYFITTHSPYVLNTIIENAKTEDVAVFKVGYEKFKTSVTQMSEKELSHALNYGNDIIFNL